MEVNYETEIDDVDSNLLNRFSSMGTTDRDVLISQFQSLLGFQLNPAGCAFFLDMTNWNLQSAIGAYYDFEGAPQTKLPEMSFLCDVTIGEGETIPPNTMFVKTWRIQNSGAEQWPSGCSLRFHSGEKMAAVDAVSITELSANENTEISVNMVSPSIPGIYQGQWRMHTTSGTPFGDVIWVIISVKQEGMLDISQDVSTVTEGRSSSSVKDIPGNMFPSNAHADVEMDDTLRNDCEWGSKR